jgi:hypothetical protein
MGNNLRNQYGISKAATALLSISIGNVFDPVVARILSITGSGLGIDAYYFHKGIDSTIPDSLTVPRTTDKG